MADEPAFELWAEWDADEQLAVLHHNEVILDSDERVERWRELATIEFRRCYEQNGGRKFPVLIDMHGFELLPCCVHPFAEAVSVFRRDFFSAHTRFAGSPRATKTVTVASRKISTSPNIFPTRAEAIAELRQQLAASQA